MAPQIRTVTTKNEFDAVMACQWASFMTPREPFWSVWFPLDLRVHLQDQSRSEPRPDAQQESSDRMWREHLANPHSTWIYITDDEVTKDENPVVLASCQWKVFETNPFPSEVPEIICPAWSSENAGAKFAAKLVKGLITQRMKWMARPHVGLSWMAVIPSARRRGLGLLLMEWGIRRADELGLETFIESSDLGQSLYRRSGLRKIHHMDLSFNVPPGVDQEEWEQLTHYYLPGGHFQYHVMWRPVRGEWLHSSDHPEPERTWTERWKIWDGKQESDGRYTIVVE